MLTKLLSVITSMFCKNKLGMLLEILLLRASSAIAKEILDKDNQKMAYEFVKALNARTDITNKEKAKIFNEQMLDWAKKIGKKMNESVVNCLRELAVNALKSELQKEEK